MKYGFAIGAGALAFIIYESVKQTLLLDEIQDERQDDFESNDVIR